jgi:hypothetical protein
MGALRGVVLAVGLTLGWAWATEPDQRLGAPPHVDDSPTAFSCTLETLLSGTVCVFEGNPAPALPAEPAWTMPDAGRQLCAAGARAPGFARADAALLAWCQAETVKAIRRCTDSPARLLDGSGRFLPSARSCYAAIGEVLAKARTLAATSGPCCRCLEENRCGDALACLKAGLGRTLAAGGRACASKACAASCGPYLPDEPPADASDREPTAPASRSSPPALAPSRSTDHDI